jgi:transcription factor MYB, plant
LPGRTDNEIKNYWRTHFKKKTKNPSDSAEKAKNRSFKRQQQQQLKKQQQQVQMQQQQLQYNMDMKGIIDLLLEENDYCTSVPSTSQETQEMVSMYADTQEQQGCFYSMLNDNSGNVYAQESSNEENLWDELWNLDDALGNSMQLMLQAKPANVHNVVAPFC